MRGDQGFRLLVAASAMVAATPVATAQPASATRWFYLAASGTADSAQLLYADLASITPGSGAVKRIVGDTITAPPTRSPSGAIVDESTTTYEADCRVRTVRITSSTDFGPQGKVSTDDKPTEWTSADPGSLAARIVDAACTGKAADSAEAVTGPPRRDAMSRRGPVRAVIASQSSTGWMRIANFGTAPNRLALFVDRASQHDWLMGHQLAVIVLASETATSRGKASIGYVNIDCKTRTAGITYQLDFSPSFAIISTSSAYGQLPVDQPPGNVLLAPLCNNDWTAARAVSGGFATTLTAPFKGE